MKKTAIAVLALCGAGAALAQATAGNDSKLELWGVADAAVRHTNNEGADRSRQTRLLGGGMSQSRWGLNVVEDMGNGTKALAHLENRFDLDTGTSATNAPFFQLSYVGLQGPFGRITAGRQWNVLFDVVTSTYASFPYSPYMEAYKPELGMSMGARASNSLKYVVANSDRSLAGGLQYAFDEGNRVPQNINTAADILGAAPLLPGILGGAIKSFGGFARYSKDGISAGGAFMNTQLPGGTKVDAWTVGGSYRSGPLYVNMGYGSNKRKTAYSTATPQAIANSLADSVLLNMYWANPANGGFSSGVGLDLNNVGGTAGAAIAGLANHADKREMFKAGVGYQVAPQVNLGLHYYYAKQSGSASGQFNGRVNFVVTAVDYAFSKRTDAYAAADYTKVRGGSGMAVDANGARSRTGFTVGLRHRF